MANMGMREEHAVDVLRQVRRRTNRIEPMNLLADIRCRIDQPASRAIIQSQGRRKPFFGRLAPAPIVGMADLRRTAILRRAQHDERCAVIHPGNLSNVGNPGAI